MQFYTLRLATAVDSEPVYVEEIDAAAVDVAATLAEDAIRSLPLEMAWRCAILANDKGETVWRLFRE